MKSKKAQVLGNLGELITSLGVIAILAAVIFLIMAETKVTVETQQPCDNTSNTFTKNATFTRCHQPTNASRIRGFSSAYNATVQTQSAMSDIPGWFPIVVITMIGGILLTLVRFFKQQQ